MLPLEKVGKVLRIYIEKSTLLKVVLMVEMEDVEDTSFYVVIKICGRYFT